MNKTILITGSDGQLGQELAEISNQFSSFNFIFKNRQSLDITNRQHCEYVLETYNPDFIINTAAYTKVDAAEVNEEEAMATNAYAMQNLGHAAKMSKIIHISTDYVYHSLGSLPLNEKSDLHPKSIYAKSKLKGEMILQSIHSNNIIIRTSWVYSKFGNNFVKTILRLAKEQDQIKIVNDQIGAPTYARDLAEAILKIITGTVNLKILPMHWNQVYNYANIAQISWYDFAREIIATINAETEVIPIKSYEYPTLANRPPWSVMDINKIRKLPGIELYPWKKSLKHCLERLIN